MSNLGNKNIMAKNIKRLLNKNNKNRSDLAQGINISYSTVSEWINANAYPRIDKIEMMANYFGVSKSELVEEYQPEIETNETEEKIAETVKELKEERKIKVLNYAKNELEEQNYIEEDAVVYSFVNMYGSISAGTGNYIEDTPVEQVKVEGIPPQHDIALKVSGDSMLPLFEDGEIVYIVKTPTIQSGQIGAFILDGEAYLKKLYSKNGKIRLVSLNKKYKDIEIDEYSELHVVGKVVL